MCVLRCDRYISAESVLWSLRYSLSSTKLSSYVSSTDASSLRMMGKRLSLESELEDKRGVYYVIRHEGGK